ncbi:rhamnogalacturonan acetylesterase [Luteolibacter sp. GHJ8]|uniref:Rhamnogalacturonan acetylesterase n=1 Tax=Luteolibacter rhizosphaerae TaxID=2989719 RepID=A0ABT3G478_9BACT|nr:rhamnogalacturonan acetylesterase [Luteolibacter rhizosphaerae]MCW1914651.1 rhamnogalacturonan acetylesterase [Luteolibacter rhizosphaerae]
MNAIFRALLLLLLSVSASLAQDERPVVKDSDLPPEEAAEQTLPALWIAGDSTVRNRGEMRGWGEDVSRFLDPAKIQVLNRAIGGRSSRTFFTEGRWDRMLGEMKKGDVVLIQFGHNDAGPLGAAGKFRGSIKGIGEETETVEKPDGTKETVQSYGWYLRHFARTAKAKGASVVLCSPVPHRKFDREGRAVADWTEWRGWVKACAEAEGVLFLDLSALIGEAYAGMGKAEVEALFADERTHTNHAGALFNARQVIAGCAGLAGKPLDGFLNEEGRVFSKR